MQSYLGEVRSTHNYPIRFLVTLRWLALRDASCVAQSTSVRNRTDRVNAFLKNFRTVALAVSATPTTVSPQILKG